MSALAALAAVEARLLVRDWTVVVFAFVFPPLVMVILAGVFGSQPDETYGMQRPDEYYVAAYLGVPVIALALIGLPVALASYRERNVLRRFEALGVSTAKLVAAQAAVTCALVILGAGVVLAVGAATYGIPDITHPWRTLLGFAAGTLTLVLLGVAIGLAVATARAAQAVGLLAFFPLWMLGGGGPPQSVMTDTMQAVADALPPVVPAIRDPWLGVSGLESHLIVLSAWAIAALLATAWLTRRPAT
ncbi:MAG TPA: ABC transporter permease [Solirubrobacteraceae bacterium]|nr:ABC transporter permease [Solirubrobacteraceae bacterium]